MYDKCVIVGKSLFKSFTYVMPIGIILSPMLPYSGYPFFKCLIIGKPLFKYYDKCVIIGKTLLKCLTYVMPISILLSPMVPNNGLQIARQLDHFKYWFISSEFYVTFV